MTTEPQPDITKAVDNAIDILHGAIDAIKPKPDRIPFNQGGLMRCCIATLADHEGDESDGTKLECKYCGNPMHVVDGCWAWDRATAMNDDGKWTKV